ncbi:hypothetical protein WCLP8_2590001 [uncultured Gammaproteobacteria bacterium]
MKPLLRAVRRVIEVRWQALRTGIANLAVLRVLRHAHPLPVAALRACDVLIMTWAGERTFPSSGIKDNDVYFGALPGLLREGGLKVGYIANPLFWMSPFPAIAENCAAAADPVLITEDCLNARDLLAALVRSLRAPFPGGKRLRLEGLDLTALARREVWIERSKWRSGQAWLRLNVGRTLHRHGVAPKAVIMSYEGQPWEKMVRAGLRRHCPDTKIIACQVSMFGAPYLSFYPSRAEITQGRSPDRLWVSGEYYADLFRRHGFPPERLDVIGAVRYQTFLDHLLSLAADGAADGVSPNRTDGLTVLCTTSIEYQESLELVHKTALAVAALGQGRVLVNFHPVTDQAFRQRLKTAVAALVGVEPDWLDYVDGGVQALLARASVVVYNSSGTAFEALAAGVPTIYVGRDLAIDQDKIPDAVAVRCRSVEELRARLVALTATDDHATDKNKTLPSPKRVGEMVASCLAPVRVEMITAGAAR